MPPLRIQPGSRFNVLLTEDRPHHPGYWTSELPRLLEPQGVAAYVAHSGQEAIEYAAHVTIHAAVIDWATPTGRPVNEAGLGDAAAAGAGRWLLEFYRRLPNRPPLVIVHNNATQRQVDRLLKDALRLGAFSVLNKPVHLEQLLRVFQRVVEREYRGAWPAHKNTNGTPNEAPGIPGTPNTRFKPHSPPPN